MADPFSIVASVVGLLAIGTKVSKALSLVISDTRSAPATIKSLGHELHGLCKVLGSLSALLSGSAIPLGQNFPAEELSELLDNIMDDFKSLQILVSKYTSKSSDGILRQRWKQLQWVFRERDVEDLRNNLEAYKATLNLTMTVAVFSGVSNNSQTADQARHQLAELKTELQEIRALCQQLRDRGGGFSSPAGDSSVSLQKVVTGKSVTSVGSVASTYRAASFIEYYCDGLSTAYEMSVDSPTHAKKLPPELAPCETVILAPINIPSRSQEALYKEPKPAVGMSNGYESNVDRLPFDYSGHRIRISTLRRALRKGPPAQGVRREPFYIHTVVGAGIHEQYFRYGQAPPETTTRIGIDDFPDWLIELVNAELKGQGRGWEPEDDLEQEDSDLEDIDSH